jgi:hypothetical protein
MIQKRLAACSLLALLLGHTLGLSALALTPEQRKVIETKAAEAKAKAALEHPERQHHALSLEDEVRLKNTLEQLTPAERQRWEALEAQQQQQGNALSQELQDDAQMTLGDLNLLWQAAVERSASIRYAIEKLSRKTNPNKALAKDYMVRRLLNTIGQLGGVGATLLTGSPLGLLSGSFLGDVLQQTAPSKTDLVSDADMVILAKAVEQVQRQLLETYYHLKFTQKNRQQALAAEATLRNHYAQALDRLQSQPYDSTLALLMKNLMDQAKQERQQQEAAYQQYHKSLGLLVGEVAVAELETRWQKPLP